LNLAFSGDTFVGLRCMFIRRTGRGVMAEVPLQAILPWALATVALGIALAATGPSQQGEGRPTEASTRSKGYWVDPETRLMWDSDASISSFNWRGAVKYCRDLRVAGYRDWRLPTIEELEQIRIPGKTAPKGGVNPVAYLWSGSQGKTAHEVWIL
jgi:hypothetical protein